MASYSPPPYSARPHPRELSLRRSGLPSSSVMHHTASQLDEGYSEETRSQSDSDMTSFATANLNIHDTELLAMLLDLPVEQRKHLLEEAVRSLPNRDKEDIGQLCERLTKFDPAEWLPNELMLHVLSHLSPKDLLTTSLVSRTWRERALDEKLWRNCFAREGWVIDRVRMAEYEESEKERRGCVASGKRPRKFHGTALERRGSRKRKTEEAFSEGDASTSAMQGQGLDEPAGASLAGNASNDDVSDSMEGVESTVQASSGGTARTVDMGQCNALMDFDSPRSSTDSDSATSVTSHSWKPQPAEHQLQVKPSLFQGKSDTPKLSWPYLYKQRCKLEKNWETNQYRMFQLPHPLHPHEGHEECVYTIQHTSNHLVSGSRDHTIRVWDLKRYRLKGQPLRGHEASVLCLQFDERPEHDIIVSGGSDAFVIVWRFSTGEIIKKMTQAHSESVLNLRFDDRYIVTCSKDKSIKIWNRHALTLDDPVLPAHVLADYQIGIAHFTLSDGHIIKEYQLLTKLEGHHAAVNAVMIHDNTIVSASGDRTIKAWNIDTGKNNKNYIGHTKGIACVQFDGRRIVSGSSDNTVRIFDAEQAAEIACLTGHNNLVRTVQARFGDLEITSADELEAEAREADRNFYRAMENGMPLPSTNTRRHRNAGSSNPVDMLSFGTKIPPGGGGSRWAKIVSGSYDETVIIWKRDRDGNWVQKAQLHQDTLLKNRAHRRVAHTALQQPSQANAVSLQAVPVAGGLHVGMNPTQQAQNMLQQAQGHLAQASAIMQQPGAGPPIPNSQHLAIIAAQNHLGAQVAGMQQQHGGQAAQGGGHGAVNASPASAAHNIGGNQPQQQQPPQAANSAPLPPRNHVPAQQNAPPPPPAAPAHAPLLAHHIHAAHHAHAAGQRADGNNNSNRVFKLQFDARRIICCSQNKVIVGWDFANGDKELERVGSWSIETA